jgi:catalase
MTDGDRDHLVSNIVAHASAGVSEAVQQRVVAYWTGVAPELGTRVAAGLTVDLTEERRWGQSEAASRR